MLGYNEITPWDEDDGKTLTKEIETLAACSREEYDKWMKSVKYQFDIGTLVNVMPLMSLFQNFKDIVVRIPNEQTLVIKAWHVYSHGVYGRISEKRKAQRDKRSYRKNYQGYKVGHEYFDSHYDFELIVG